MTLEKPAEDIKALARRFGIRICDDISEFVFVREKKQIIPYAFAKQKGILPLEESGGEIIAATSDPMDLASLEELRLYLDKSIIPVYCSKAVLETAIEQCYRQKEGEAKRLFSDLSQPKNASAKEEMVEGYDLLEQGDQNPVIRMVNAIILEAIQQGASDIHLEPGELQLSVRYRIDGALVKRDTPPRDAQAAICTRIKVMAKMDIAEHRLPQDGRIKLNHGGREIDFRVSTIPTVYGERIVLRILDRGNIVLGLEKIGMDEKTLKAFRRMIHAPEGIVLVTGPTGSGKTTTLYSALSEMNSDDTNILTIEDPVEYKLKGISQMNVNPRIDLDFAKGLRHFLRQDPDVIMIGEIRDRETAEIAIQASLTGHLVLSTLHTNDAPSAITRLADMGIEPYLLSSSLIGVLAQRLVRRICPHCRISYTPLDDELAELGLTKDQLSEGKLFRGEGCELCFHTGYKGRHGIYELMPMHAKIKAQVMKSADAQELRKAARGFQMVSLFEQGCQLVTHGLSTSSEILRVTRIDEKAQIEG
ncbi:MAG: epsE [Parachlamydiales bacterium]|nr:epsE [Parachlamydiales bacterium]